MLLFIPQYYRLFRKLCMDIHSFCTTNIMVSPLNRNYMFIVRWACKGSPQIILAGTKVNNVRDWLTSVPSQVHRQIVHIEGEVLDLMALLWLHSNGNVSWDRPN